MEYTKEQLKMAKLLGLSSSYSEQSERAIDTAISILEIHGEEKFREWAQSHFGTPAVTLISLDKKLDEILKLLIK